VGKLVAVTGSRDRRERGRRSRRRRRGGGWEIRNREVVS